MSTTDNPSPAEAEAGADEARAGLVSTLNQLRENLKPANVVNEVMGNAKVSASAISEQIWDTARRNPLPALMIGAGIAMILGLGQRAVSSRDRARPARRPAPAVNSPGLRPGGPEFAAHISRPAEMQHGASETSITDPAVAALTTAKNRTVDFMGSANERLSALAERGVGAARGAFGNNTSTQGATMSSYSRTRDQLSDSISKALEEQPLILAAIGIAVGAAIGAAIPQTETENSLMGQTSGSVKDAAQGLVQDQYAQLKSAAGHAVEDIKQTVADHGVNADNLSGLVQDVGAKAKAATYEAGKTLDPTT